MSDPCLALVFDDGFASDFEELRPVFREIDAPATFAIVPGWLGEDNRLTVDQLRTLADEGHEVLAHGTRHRFMGTHRVTVAVDAGERAVVVDDHVFPGDDHGVYPGDTYEVTDGDRRETATLAGKRDSEDGPVLVFEEPLDGEYAAGEAVCRLTQEVLEDEILGVREDFRELGFDPTGWVFPYDAADARAYCLAADAYGTIANASIGSLPNPPGTPPTNWRRYYLQTSHLTRPEIASYLETLSAQGGVGVLAGHSDWPSVTPERVRFVIAAARERGIDVTTLRAAAEGE